MPVPLAAAGAAIAAGAAAVGSAAMSAVAGITLSGLATGATILGAGMQLVGAATGSKTLSKVGMGFSIAGGLGSVAGALRPAAGVAGVTGNTASKGLLATSSMDDVASASSKAKASSQGFKSFNGNKAVTGSMDSFKVSADGIGATGVAPGSIATPTAGGMDLDLEKNYFQRANQSLTQYNPLMNVVGGVGEAYMMKQRMDLEEKMLDKRLNIDQQTLDRINRNNGTALNVNPALNLTRDTQAYNGFLGR